MLRRALEVLACPDCGAPLGDLAPDAAEVESGSIRCPSGHAFSIEKGVPVLIAGPDRERLRAFGDSYAQAWARDGWGGEDPEYLRNLPYRDTTARHRSEWRVKARSLDALLAAWTAEGPLRIADVGCGMGWLAHHLAARGHEVYAVDALLDDAVGLGAAGVLSRSGPYFERVCADLERPPFRVGALDAVVCNASLHYSATLDATLANLSRILRRHGRLVVMNSPVYREAASARRAEADFRKHLRDVGAAEAVANRYNHFVRTELETVLRRTVGPVREVPFDPGAGFRAVRTLKGLALRMELASFPILIATKEHEPPADALREGAHGSGTVG